MSLILALLLAASPCKATTSVPEFKAEIRKACRPGLISFDLSGDHETLTETIVLDKDLGGRDLTTPAEGINELFGTPVPPEMSLATIAGFHAAMESAKIIGARYPSTTFVWRVRDRMGRPICHFTVTDEQTTGRCSEHP